MERCNNTNREGIPKTRLWSEVPLDAPANTSQQSFQANLWPIPLTNKTAKMLESKLLVYIPISQTLEMEVEFVSCIFFSSSEKETCLGFGLRASYSVKVSKTKDRVWWAILALQAAEDRCPVGSCHTSHPHTLLSLVHIRQHHHTLPRTSIFNYKTSWGFCVNVLQSVICRPLFIRTLNKDLVLPAIISSGNEMKKGSPWRCCRRPKKWSPPHK